MKYDFLCELCEQEHHILSVRFLFIFGYGFVVSMKGMYKRIFTSFSKCK